VTAKARSYTDAEREFFAQWRTARAECKPKQCNGGRDCWAIYGPPAIISNYGCVGCGGTPRARDIQKAGPPL
jgi:hypothetical protein